MQAKNRLAILTVLIGGLFLASNYAISADIVVTGSAVAIGGGKWQYDFSIVNLTSNSFTVDKIRVQGGYPSAPTITSTPSGWTGSIVGDKVQWDYTDGPGTIVVGPNSSISGFAYESTEEPSVGPWYIDLVGDTDRTGSTVVATPVELLSFAAQVVDNGIVLTWATASETENLGFYVYRSESAEAGSEPQNRDLIPGTGNSSRLQKYSWLDENVTPGKAYYYKLVDVDFNGNSTFHGPISVTAGELPNDYALEQNYPNPFNPSTNIRFTLPEGGEVALAIYNIQGRQIRTLVSGDLAAGTHSFMWDGTSEDGKRVASGIYLYELRAKNFTARKKLVLSK